MTLLLYIKIALCSFADNFVQSKNFKNLNIKFFILFLFDGDNKNKIKFYINDIITPPDLLGIRIVK